MVQGARGKGAQAEDYFAPSSVLVVIFGKDLVEPIPTAQNKEAKVDPRKKIYRAVKEYLKFIKIAGSVSLNQDAAVFGKTWWRSYLPFILVFIKPPSYTKTTCLIGMQCKEGVSPNCILGKENINFKKSLARFQSFIFFGRYE